MPAAQIDPAKALELCERMTKCNCGCHGYFGQGDNGPLNPLCKESKCTGLVPLLDKEKVQTICPCLTFGVEGKIDALRNCGYAGPCELLGKHSSDCLACNGYDYKPSTDPWDYVMAALSAKPRILFLFNRLMYAIQQAWSHEAADGAPDPQDPGPAVFEVVYTSLMRKHATIDTEPSSTDSPS